MTAHSPHPARPAPDLPSEQPPDPGAEQAAQRETRRLIDMSRGILQVAVGIACLVIAVAYLQPWQPSDLSVLLIPLPLVLVGTGVTTAYYVKRARQRAGIPNVTLRGGRSTTSRWVLGAVVALGLLAGLVAVLLEDSTEVPEGSAVHLEDNMDLFNPGSLPFTLFVLIIAIPLAWRGIKLGLWEDVLIAAGIPLGFGLMMVEPGPRGTGWLCLGLGLTQIIAGYCLHRRWQAWVAALPKPVEQDSADAEMPV